MTGFAPNMELLRQVGVPIDPATGIPTHDPDTLETTDARAVHRRRRGRRATTRTRCSSRTAAIHGDKIVARLLGRPVPPPPRLSAELDT